MATNKGMMGIILSSEGIERLSFLGKTKKQREKALEMYSAIKELLHELDKAIKQRAKVTDKNLR